MPLQGELPVYLVLPAAKKENRLLTLSGKLQRGDASAGPTGVSPGFSPAAPSALGAGRAPRPQNLKVKSELLFQGIFNS